MEYSKCVSVSGYMLSYLLYEHNSCYSDQEGFLIGNVIIRQTESISDNQISLKKEETTINIYSHVPCEDVLSFYSYDCEIDIDKLKMYLKDKMRDVVGWYRFRRHTPLVMSLREKAVHRKLADLLPYAKKFVFGLFTSHVSENAATHTFDHIFYLYDINKGGPFEPISLNIVNLEDSTQAEYRMFPRAPINTRMGSLSELASSARSEAQVLGSASLAEEINTVLLDKIEGFVEQVSASEAEIGFLALEIKELQEKIAKLTADGNDVQFKSQSERLSSTECECSESEQETEDEKQSESTETENISTEIVEKGCYECTEKEMEQFKPVSSSSEVIAGVDDSDDQCARTRYTFIGKKSSEARSEDIDC